MAPQNTTSEPVVEETQNGEIDPQAENYLKAGRRLAIAPPGDEVVITGMSGRFPDSDDCYHYRYNLLNKVDMVSCDNRRWEPTHPEIPQRIGKINFIEKFDAGFFGVHYRQAEALDPQCRQLLERSFEAILDAGLHPDELRGSNTGVFGGACFSETEKTWFYDRLESPTFGVTGCIRSMLAQRVSYFLGLQGPSFTVDTACSSSLYAFEHAYRAIRLGRCENALVLGSALCLHPIVSLQFARLGVLSLDGSCKSFDADANGYARSETVSVVFLQKAKNAKRIYAQILHAKTNCDGFKEQGITFPSGTMQKQLLDEVYSECNTDPSTIDFLEAHATGTKVGDPEEILAMDEVFCTNRKTPLFIGSIKSNLGHTEPASGICSIVKVLLAMENSVLLPNINYTRPREGAEALEQGRMIVVTDVTPWPKDGSGVAAINSFGFGGANCHVVLKRYNKEKVDGGLPRDNLPRLVCVSGRTEESITYFLDDVKSRPLDAEFVRLIHDVFRNDIPGHLYRGYSIISKEGEIKRSLKWFDQVRPPLYAVFGGPHPQWVNIGQQLFTIPLFAATVQRIHNILSCKGIHITNIICQKAPVNDIVDVIIGCTAIQIGLIDILKTLEVSFDMSIGYSTGELASAYCNGSLTLEQAIVAAQCVGNCLLSVSNGTNGNIAIPKELSSLRESLLQHLKQVISKPSQLEELVDHILASPVNLEEISISQKPVILEIGAESVNLSNFATVHLVQENEDVVNSLVNSFGELYELGYNPKFDKFYPKVQWPVSVNTPMISPLIKWNHSHDWFVALYKAQERMKTGERIITFSIRETDSAFLLGHLIDGRNLVPATLYLHLVWETFSIITGLLLTDTKVVFENVRFHRATNIPRNSPVALIVMVQKETGKFEVAESGAPVCSGRIFKPDEFSDETIDLPLPIGEPGIVFETKDIYKELKLRGYNYMGLFRGLKECDLSATKGSIEWTGNWVAFIDNMLQIKIIQEDTRNLYVPTGIERLAIDAKAHIRIAQQLGENPVLPVYVYKECDLIKSGAIEIRGLFASSIPRRKALGQPVLESYKFVPYKTKLTLDESIRVAGQIFLENSYGFKIRAVELIDSATNPESTPLSPVVHQIYSDQPLINPDIAVFSKETMELTGITVEDKKLSAENNTCALVAASKLLSRQEIMEQAATALKENGIIISREELSFDHNNPDITLSNLDIISVHQLDTEKIVILRKTIEYKEPVVIDVSKCLENYDWLPTLQNAVKNDEKVVIFAQNEHTHGILGLFNCIRREPGGLNVKCFFIDDNAPKFDINNEFYSKQLKQGLSINVYRDGKWGSYRHLLLNKTGVVECEHVFNNVTVRGDMSSLRWIEGPLTSKTILPPEKKLVHIYYAAINFRDIMTASGRISNDVITRDRIEQNNVQGFEFAGRDVDGKRVMGMVTSGALSSMVIADSYITWDVPDHWTMEDAVTVPVTYGTVLYGIHVIANIQEGQSILIHAGTGGVGQAAINCCLYFKCDIFVTVGTQEKRDWIKENFPQIPESHIGNSRDTSFEQMVLRETNGRGVDVVLNSLSEEKLQASVRCLAPGGCFLEIGKFDLASNNRIGLKNFTEGRSFHGVMLDAFFTGLPSLKDKVFQLLAEGFTTGCVKPLTRTIFKEDEVEQAFRHMASGKHIGKIVIRLREEEPDCILIPPYKLYNGLARFYANPEKSYIVIGGLGGFGLELADWLVTRGAKKLVLSSRTGVKNGYQASRIRIWKTYGVTTEVCTEDVTTNEGCVKLLTLANNFGPVDAIYNLAVVLKDALLENQTEETFRASLAPKAVATQQLDVVSRQLCPDLKHFVVFSSVVCGRGNPGQTTYGLANSIMERICEQRKAEGYPALAIQWGAIGEVGLVAEMQELHTEIEIGGTLQQRILSCLDVMDTFLAQDEPVVSSIVVAEKRSGAAGADNIVDAVKNILGLRDLKTISPHSTLSELGMDSMMAVEIKQTLEREYEVFLTAQDIRSMTFARLQEIAQEKASENEGDKAKTDSTEAMPTGIHLLFRTITSEDLAHTPMLRLQTLIKEKAVAPKVFLLPGIEGIVSPMEPLAANLACHAFGLQFTYKNKTETKIEELAESLLPLIHENLPKTTPFTIVAYSFGCVVALQLVAMLEEEGRSGRVVLIDGAPDMFKEFLMQHVPEIDNEALLQTLVLCTLMQYYLPVELVLMHKNEILNCKNYEERINIVLKLAANITPYTEEYQRQVFHTSYNRIKMVLTYKPKFAKIKSTVKLFKPSRPTLEGFDEDFKVQALCENPIEIMTFEGHHLTILKNPQVAYSINTIFDTTAVGFNKPIRAEIEAVRETIKNI